MSKARGPYRVDPLGYKKKSNEALDKKAENARELGLDYEPAQQESVNQRAYEIALRQWDHWKTYALMLQAKLVKYEGGSPMVLNTSPPAQHKPLTDEEINEFFQGIEPNNGFWLSFARAIEAAHGIKENT